MFPVRSQYRVRVDQKEGAPMADMKLKVSITGTLDETERRAFARYMGMEGEPVADIKRAVAEVMEERIWFMLGQVIDEEGTG